MKKKFGFFLLVLQLVTVTLFAQLQSPEQFLGYKVGTRFTPHWRIVDYFKHVAANAGTMVKLQPYGQTNEGRPLMVAFISSAANLSNLEQIRTNNLALAQMQRNNQSASTAGPVVVWLSYNVHGNETSSSEASMLTLYSLVDPANARTKPWLQNTVVIIDPCLNPDGRDRYVSWFNSVAGKYMNPQPDAREHREPWPGGRPNHYYFDLNRDWAWQTQKESVERLKLYNEWLPQVHVDFHEQGINNPYYFAPAAEPFHELITPFQRSFQNTIGRNHARYFDEKGWLYFTKERFDLLYPAYGDTYPIYNGSIGMTYEQGGGPAGGLSILTANGDTLTLVDRVLHHYTTGLSTVEVASQNASKLLTEYQTFFRNANTTGVGPYKAYVIKYAPQDKERIDALLNLLDKNKIEYGVAKGGSLRGYSYDSGKEEGFNATEKDIVIPGVQPKATLLSVLFEANTKLVDSATYDITAWSLPYVYGLKTFASKTAVPYNEKPNPTGSVGMNTTADAYGYVMRWSGVQSVKMALQLAEKGIKLRMSELPFETGGNQFERGAIIILKTSNQYYPNLWDTVRQTAMRSGLQLTAITSGFVEKGSDFGSSNIRPFNKRRVALVSGEGISPNGVGEVWHLFDQVLGYPITLINAADLSRADWSSFDVLIMPDGAYRFLSDKTSADAFKAWINGGGNVVAIEGAVAQISKLDWAIKSKKMDEEDTKNKYEALHRYEDRERDFIPGTTPGSIFKVALDNTHPLAFGYPDYYYTLKMDNAIYDFIKEGGWNVGVLKKEKKVAGFVGSKLVNRLQDGLLFGTQEVGRGNVTYLADDVLFRSFWENGKLMFCNAVFLVGQ